MHSKSLKGLSAGLLLVMLLIVIPIISITGHGDKKHDDEQPSDTTSETTVDSTANSVRDSIYALINEKYQSVRHIFKYSCFDCHSDTTDYPWYYKIPGITGMIDDDIKEAKEHLDLTNDFPFGGHASQEEQLREIKEEIEDGSMPIKSYRFTHWGRLIEDEKQDSVFVWINESIALLKSIK